MPPRARISQLSSRSVVAVTLTLPLRFYFRSISFPQFQLTSVYFPLSTLQPFWFQKRGFLPHAPCADAPVVLWIIFIFKCSVHDTIHSKSILALNTSFSSGKGEPNLLIFERSQSVCRLDGFFVVGLMQLDSITDLSAFKYVFWAN